MLCAVPGLWFLVFAARLILISFRNPREGGCVGTLTSVFWFDFVRFPDLSLQREHSSR